MPTYLAHGFRWPRPLIRIHIILQNLDDAASEWLVAPPTTAALLDNFRALYPTIMPALPGLRFLEQYDPLDETSPTSKSQPFAYVCDVVHEVQLGVDVDEVRGQGVSNDAWGAMVELRDKLAPGEKVAWFVVVCGDLERWAPPVAAPVDAAAAAQWDAGPEAPGDEEQRQASSSRGLKKWFGKSQLRKSKSSRDLTGGRDSRMSENPPPLPGQAV
ncbi:hypothetical protein BDY21DRAFT_373357 [Lineolata rhizophorae]|uniref:Uncharacterized protein n=1 Tax=Lineolata rhizophorae TaxID=578093 RepID=A0A6A6NTY9_9PEZI|nr:hypothetical protein BDY21DRAFT_373357 [Lineolata rhizophorae]